MGSRLAYSRFANIHSKHRTNLSSSHLVLHDMNLDDQFDAFDRTQDAIAFYKQAACICFISYCVGLLAMIAGSL